MDPVLIKAYSCPRCKEVYKTKRKTTSCIKKHIKLDAAEAAKIILRKEFEKAGDKVRLSVDSFYNVGPALEAHAKSLGYHLTCHITGKIKLQCTSHSHPIGATEKYQWGGSDANAHNERYGKSLAFSGNIKGTFIPQKGAVKPLGYVFGVRDGIPRGVSDWVKVFAFGINTGGGSGGKSFSYGLTMYVEDFPKILNKSYKDLIPLHESYEEFIDLADGNDLWESEKRELTREYESEYLKWKRFSDPTWAVYNQEIKDIAKEISALSESKREFTEKRSARSLELDDEREEKTAIIINKDFNKVRYNRLKDIFGRAR